VPTKSEDEESLASRAADGGYGMNAALLPDGMTGSVIED
jgi:hypothetical protein